MHRRTLAALFATGLCASPAGAATFAVTSNADSGANTLRAAITAANATPAADTVTFNLAAGQRTIALASSLPTVTAALDINGTSQPGYGGVPLVRVDGVSLPAGHDALRINAGQSTVRGLMVTRAPGTGVVIQGGSGIHVHSNYLGTDGSVALGNGTGLRLDGGALNTIGNTTAGRHNVISGNLDNGITVGDAASFNQFVNNRIGTNAAGTVAVPNGYAGIRMFGHDNTVGDGNSGGNLISGNGRFGVDNAGDDNSFYGNRIGTDLAGNAAVPNVDAGIDDSGNGSQIGGVVAGTGNLLSGSGNNGLVSTGDDTVIVGNRVGTRADGNAALSNGSGGVQLHGDRQILGEPGAGNLLSGNPGSGALLAGSGATVRHNRFGTNAAGTAAIGNGYANLRVFGSDHVIADNLISGSGRFGIEIGSDAVAVTVQANRIGTDVDGDAALPNATGIASAGDDILLGGQDASQRNVIAGNTGEGVVISGAQTRLLNNYIGVDVAGLALGNGGIAVRSFGVGAGTVLGAPGAGNVIANNARGIEIEGLPHTVQGNTIGLDPAQAVEMRNGGASGIAVSGAGHQIGGAAAGAGNTIVAAWGVVLYEGADANVIEGNFIGTDAAQTQVFGSGYSGINIYRADANTIGGTAPGAGNVIRGAGFGVYVALGTGNAVLGNTLSDNDLAGIELNPIGPDANDAADADHGPNEGQNRPVLTAAQTSGGDVQIAGVLASRASATYRVELFHSDACHVSGLGEGASLLGALDVTTAANGNAGIAITLPNPHGAGVVTATATDADGNTSEFSPCIDIGAPHAGRFTVWRDPYLAYEDVPAVTIHVLRSGGLAGNTSVRLRTVDGSATAPADYAAIDTVLTFPAGEWIRTVEVPLVLDADDGEGTESFDVELTSPTGGATVVTPSAQVLLFDHDDAAPFLSVDDAGTLPEPAAGQAMASFTIRLSPTDHSVAVGYETFDGSAVAGSDYVATSGLFTFTPGVLEHVVQVPVLADALGEGEETFHLRLIGQGDPLVAYISEGQAVILDADGGADAIFRDGFE